MNKNITLNHLHNDFKIKLKVKDITFFHDNIIEYQNHKKELKEWEVEETFKEIYNLIYENSKPYEVEIDINKINKPINSLLNKQKIISRETNKRSWVYLYSNCSKIKDCFSGWVNESETFETMKKIYYYQMSRKWKTRTKKSFKRNKSLLN